MAFPVVTIVLSVDLSLDGYFNGVSEQKLFFNQPVEVRVRCEGLECQLGKFSGGVSLFFKFSVSQRSRFPLPFNRPLPAAETMSVCLALDYLNNAIKL